ncbi:uncharacterized protein LOC113766291 [Coffea eugenioides]|uniref:uncharacterized protein LOC113766291 n=1 Tax=Coffea eugenioides TaxID=49369 RepID=UPI000F606E0C|nr:uncharacterized protein LOC113766291 [Coffea eugenioides]
MAENSQQFGVRFEGVTRRVNEVNHSDLANRLTELTALIRQITRGQVQATKACGICTAPKHMTDMCLTLQEDLNEQASAMRSLPGPPQRRNDPYAPTYNLGWGNHPNFSNAPKPSGFQQPFQQRPPVQQPFASNSETRTSIRNLETQMSQLASLVSNLENGKGKLSSQFSRSEATRAEDEQVSWRRKKLAKTKKEESEKEILDTFRKAEINILLLDTIRQLSKYAKFLRGLCINWNKLNFHDKVKVGKNVSTVLQRKLPQKCNDPGMFTIPCIIGQKRIDRGMLDLGASINVKPLSIFRALNLGPLKDTRVIIQLVDRSNVYPEGVVEDVLVKVNEFIFPADFYFVDMNDDNSVNSTVLLMGRPFMSMARTKIDMHEVTGCQACAIIITCSNKS